MNDNELLEKERKKELLGHTFDTLGWKEIVEPELRRALASARAGSREAMSKETIEQAGKKFVESMAVEIALTNILRKFNTILGVKEDFNA